VHSNEQIRASLLSGGRSRSQHSQPGRSSSIRRFPSPHATGPISPAPGGRRS
jgi:hypothetical protein